MNDTQAVNDNQTMQPEHWVVLVLKQGEQRVIVDSDPDYGVRVLNKHRADFEEERQTRWHPSFRIVYCDDSATLLLLARKLWNDDGTWLAQMVAEMLAQGCMRYDDLEGTEEIPF